MAAENLMSDDELRSRLLSYGQKVGPVTLTTRDVYLRKLKALQSSQRRSTPLKPSFNRRHLGGFSSDESDADEKETSWSSSSGTAKSPAYDSSPSRPGDSFGLFGRGASSRSTTRGNDLSYSASSYRVADGEEVARRRTLPDSTGLCRPSINGIGKNYQSPMRNMADSVSDFRFRANNNTDYRATADAYRNDSTSGFNFSGGSARGTGVMREGEFTPPTAGVVPRKPFSGRLFPNRDESNRKANASYTDAPFSQNKNKSTHAVGRWQHVSMILFALCLGFFVVLAYIYWDMTSSNSDLRNNFLLCSDDDDTSFHECVPRRSESVLRSLIKQSINLISTRAGAFDCGYEESRNVSVQEYEAFMKQEAGKYVVWKADMKTLILRLFIENPHWSVRLYDSDNNLTTNASLVRCLMSERSQMSVWCRFRMSALRVIEAITTVAAICTVVLLGYAIFRFWVKRKEEEMQEVVKLVERILDKLKQHADACLMQSDLKPYLAIAHVRDSLIPLQDRYRMQRIWDKAVQFIEAHESRVRTENQMIEAEEFIVWRWVSPATDVTKVWQGQAFGEHSNKIQSYPPLTTCLKIRNMFDVDVEYGDDWHVSIEDAILEKCGPNHGILHVAVDQMSQDGCVYVRCRDLESVGRAFKALHGWWFDGKLVTVKYLREQRYFERFPEAMNAVEAVKPSNANQSSLSQPFHSSIMESS